MTHLGRPPLVLLTRGLDPVGTGRQVELAARRLRDSGHAVTVAVTTGGGSVPDRLARDGFAVRRLASRPRAGALATVRLARLVRRLPAGAVTIAFGRGQAAVGAAVRRLVPASRLVAVVELAPRRPLDRFAARRADRLVVPDASAHDAWRAAGARAPVVVPPGIEPVAGTGLSRADLARRLGLRADSVWTLCVAPLDPEAHVDRLLWAIDQLGVVHRGLEHVLVGAGPHLERVRRRARLQHLAERLFVFPALECLPDLLQQVRLVWQPGDVAAAGCLLDGMALGVAAVAVRSAAACRVVDDGVEGRIVEAEPISEFPRRALAILEDDAVAATYGAAARRRAAEGFPAARFCDALAEQVAALS